jgi:dsDNA-specific endonuclease/ATPase MutS2
MVPANPAPAPKSIDLHGMSADNAIRAVEQHLNRVILNGTGRVRSAVHNLLSSLGVVRAFRLNDENPGETDVYF